MPSITSTILGALCLIASAQAATLPNSKQVSLSRSGSSLFRAQDPGECWAFFGRMDANCDGSRDGNAAFCTFNGGAVVKCVDGYYRHQQECGIGKCQAYHVDTNQRSHSNAKCGAPFDTGCNLATPVYFPI